MERPEGFLAALFGNTRSVVVHYKLDASALAPDAHLDVAAIFQSIVDQVDETTLHRVALDRDGQGFGDLERNAAIGLVRGASSRQQLRSKRQKFGGLRRFAAFAARKFEIFVQHALHLGEIARHSLGIGVLRHHGELQAQTGQRVFRS